MNQNARRLALPGIVVAGRTPDGALILHVPPATEAAALRVLDAELIELPAADGSGAEYVGDVRDPRPVICCGSLAAGL